ncbi:hypothetical protein NLG97_g9799 [Lecanicillium saksenae]|uniref:Uncharacterized protein n=1 Tax=Lecanicillium saksenae TaxID=468837 RepID=A0ACC1QHQ1_9HYPO|nr:hypothetical protein NLG97_g9799 [Lecanicillium saksenae]
MYFSGSFMLLPADQIAAGMSTRSPLPRRLDRPPSGAAASPAAAASKALEARWINGCGDDYFSNMGDAWACYNYLNGLGTTDCGVPEGQWVIQMCQIGNAHVYGQKAENRHVSSYCRDVAIGLRWVLENCGHNGNQEVSGQAVAWGNGDLLVSITTRDV